jgi:hypothetical protein
MQHLSGYGITSTEPMCATTSSSVTSESKLFLRRGKDSWPCPSRSSHRTSTTLITLPGASASGLGPVVALWSPAATKGLRRSVTRNRGTRTNPHSKGIIDQVRLASVPGRRIGTRPLRTPETMKASMLSTSMATVTCAVLDGCLLRITIFISVGRCSRAVGAT